MGLIFIYLFIVPFSICNYLFLNVEGGERKGERGGGVELQKNGNE